MLNYIMGFVHGTFFGFLLGVAGGIVAAVVVKAYTPEIKALLDKALEALS
jgi:uncharacterized protein (DUF697 family)